MKLKPSEVLILKKVKHDKDGLYTEYREKRFNYPKKGMVEATDWIKISECGNGLHGLEWGSGTFDIEDYGDIFLVIRVDKKDGYVGLEDKVKFRKGNVILATTKVSEAIGLIKKHCPKDTVVNYDNSNDVMTNQGYRSTANQGYRSTANQGYCSIANQEYLSTANQMDRSTANQGNVSTANQGYWSTANQGYRSTANQGYQSTVTVHGGDLIYRNESSLSAIIMFYDDKMYIFRGDKDFEPNETVLIQNHKIVKRYPYSSDKITELTKDEIFVFGSNLNGNHSGGAAKLALDKFGAIRGQGEGLQGQSYAFPTLGKNMRKLKEWRLKKAIQNLIDRANQNTTKVFLVTKVGCGIAGFKEDYIKGLFAEFKPKLSANIVLPKGWY